MTNKLTLSMNPEIVSRAKQYAEQRGLSVSKIVETYLSAVSQPAAKSVDPPALRALRGSLKNADLTGYRDHLVRKHL